MVKRGQYGESVYLNRFYSVKNGALGSKHIFAGETRIVTKLEKDGGSITSGVPGSIAFERSQGLQNAILQGSGQKKGIHRRLAGADSSGSTVNPPIEKFQFFYHGDHLGSSSFITDDAGAVYQHLEYFPYGETWVESGGGGHTPGYKFTGKELDPETGLYYYGARYYDPVLSRWISADPILAKYLPTVNQDVNQNLPGFGGVFNSANINLYSYTHNNPVKLLDPDGNATAGERTKAQEMVYAYITAEEVYKKHNPGQNLYSHPPEGKKGPPGCPVDCSGISKSAYPVLPDGTGAQRAATAEVPLEDVMEGDLVFFYTTGGHVGVVTKVTRDAEGKLVEFVFGHTTGRSGARENTVRLPTDKDKKGSYWYGELHSVRTVDPETDPPRPSASTWERIGHWFRSHFPERPDDYLP